LRTYSPRRSFQGGLAKEAKDGWHLTRLIHLVVADMAKGAPWAPFSFSPPEVAASEKREEPSPETPAAFSPCSGAPAGPLMERTSDRCRRTMWKQTVQPGKL
jgi:hypothetical protein